MIPPVLLRADARALPLADESVDLVVTSPPYYGLRDYGTPDQIGAEQTPAQYLDQLLAATAEASRVLRPTGSLFVNLGDRYAANSDGYRRGVKHSARQPRVRPGADVPDKSLMLLPERYRLRCIDELGLTVRQVLVWSKPNGLPERATDRCRRSHEEWVHLTRARYYWADLDGLRDAPTGYQRDGRAQRATPPGQRPRAMADSCNPAGRLPGSVWTVATQPLNVPEHVGADHYAAFPMEWPRRLITGWCPPGGVVLDPFGGTGTTALVAAMLGRTGISVDSSADYQRVAAWRCTDPRERARAAGLDASRVPAARPDQTGLFDLPGGAA